MVARVVAATMVASEVTTRTTLEAAKQSAGDRATAAQSAATTATERDALATRMALAEADREATGRCDVHQRSRQEGHHYRRRC